MHNLPLNLVRPITAEQARRIRREIEACDRYIFLEERRAADLRPARVSELLASYKEHRAKLAAEVSDDA